MSGYRYRATKPTGMLWLLVGLADAGWAATSGVVALYGALVIIGIAAIGAFAYRAFSATMREPVRGGPLRGDGFPCRVIPRRGHRALRYMPKTSPDSRGVPPLPAHW